MRFKTELVPVPTIVEVTNIELDVRTIHVVGIDIENVLTGAGTLPVFPFARGALDTLQERFDRKLILISNASNMPFVEEVSAVTGLPYEVRNEATGIRSKMHPEIYQKAAKRVGCYTTNMAMIDDQLKNYRGANQAGLRAFFWTKATGSINHSGVKVSSAVENTVLRPTLRIAQYLNELRRGDW